MSAVAQRRDPFQHRREQGGDLVAIAGDDILIIADAIGRESDRFSFTITRQNRDRLSAPTPFKKEGPQATEGVGAIPGVIPRKGLER